MKKALLCFVFLFTVARVEAKVFVPHYPEFYEQHLHQKVYSIDTSAEAVILYQITEYSLVKIVDRYFMHRHVRKVVKILSDKGKEYGDILVQAYSDGGATGDFTSVNGKTYYLQDGSLQEEKLDKGTVVREYVNDHIINLKFSLPAVQVGAVIEYQYAIDEPLSFSIGTEFFQKKIPTLYAELSLALPDIIKTTSVMYGGTMFQDFDDTKRNVPDSLIPGSFRNEFVEFDKTRTNRWVVRNVPGYIEEDYVSNIQNYLNRISIQISRMVDENGIDMLSKDKMFNNWQSVDNLYLNDETSLKKIDQRARYINDALLNLSLKGLGQLQKVQAIYRFVRDSFNVSDNSKGTKRLREVFEQKTGSEADLNLAFISMLRAAGIKCNAAVLSTTDELKLTSIFPVLSQIDYLITVVKVDGQSYVADPSEKYDPFGVLNAKCYNGYARVIDADSGYGMVLNTDQLVDKCRSMITTKNADPANYILSIKYYFGDVSGPSMRKEIMHDTSTVLRQILKELPANIDLVDYKVENLVEIEDRLCISYDIHIPWSGQAVYMDPLVANYFTTDPFTSTKRYYPIELPHAIQHICDANIQVPPGYKLIDTVVSIQYNLNASDKFKYIAVLPDTNNLFRLHTELSLKQTVYNNTDIDSLRSFFDKMIGLQQTPYYFKKI